MPTYEYKCDACGFRFERFQSITAKPVRKCPKCGKSKVKRLISAGGGMIFKGSGFYITDYRDSKYKESAKADSSSSGESSGGQTDKGEKATPAAKEGANEAKPATPAAGKSGESAAPVPAKSEPKPTKSSKSRKSES
jgi:putative FmdB family regulatory protein